MKLAILSKASVRTLSELFYEALLPLLLEGFTGKDAMVAIQSGLSLRGAKQTTLNDPKILDSLAVAIQRYAQGQQVSEEEIKSALIEAMEMIFGPGGKLSNQAAFAQRPTKDDLRQLYQSLIQTLRKPVK